MQRGMLNILRYGLHQTGRGTIRATLRMYFGNQTALSDERYGEIATDENKLNECINKEVVLAKEFLKQLDGFDTYYQILDEIKNRRTTSLQEPPEIFGDYEYFSQVRIYKDHSYHVLLRQPLKPNKNSRASFNGVEVVFDPHGDKIVPYKYLGTHSVFTNSLSQDQDKCFVVVDIKTDERPTGFIKDLKTQRVLSERLHSAAEGQFNTKGTALLYIQRDEKLRNSRLVYHKLETLDEDDVLLYQEPDESVWLGLEVSKCKQYLILSKVSKRGNELFLANRDFENPADGLKFVQLSSELHPIHDLRFNQIIQHNGKYSDSAEHVSCLKPRMVCILCITITLDLFEGYFSNRLRICVIKSH